MISMNFGNSSYSAQEIHVVNCDVTYQILYASYVIDEDILSINGVSDNFRGGNDRDGMFVVINNENISLDSTSETAGTADIYRVNLISLSIDRWLAANNFGTPPKLDLKLRILGCESRTSLVSQSEIEQFGFKLRRDRKLKEILE